METVQSTIRFELGQVAVTPGVRELMNSGKFNVLSLLRRHLAGDWGDLCSEDQRLNERSLQPGHEGCLFSSYQIGPRLKVWVITEWDRSVTTVLLPIEY